MEFLPGNFDSRLHHLKKKEAKIGWEKENGSRHADGEQKKNPTCLHFAQVIANTKRRRGKLLFLNKLSLSCRHAPQPCRLSLCLPPMDIVK